MSKKQQMPGCKAALLRGAQQPCAVVVFCISCNMCPLLNVFVLDLHAVKKLCQITVPCQDVKIRGVCYSQLPCAHQNQSCHHRIVWVGCKNFENECWVTKVVRDVLDLPQRCCSCISHKRDVLLVGEGNVERVAALGQGAVVPCWNSRFCNLDVVRPDKTDVCHQCGHPVVVPFLHADMCDHVLLRLPPFFGVFSDRKQRGDGETKRQAGAQAREGCSAPVRWPTWHRRASRSPAAPRRQRASPRTAGAAAGSRRALRGDCEKGSPAPHIRLRSSSTQQFGRTIQDMSGCFIEMSFL